MLKEEVRQSHKNRISYMLDEELEMANTLYPPFHSSMEGLGVIQEEYDEAMDDVEQIEIWFKLFKQELRTETPNVQYYSKQMKLHIQNAILELIQVSTMLRKYEDSL